MIEDVWPRVLMALFWALIIITIGIAGLDAPPIPVDPHAEYVTILP